MTECFFSSSWVSEGDGVMMLNECSVHPEYRWYGYDWPSGEDLARHHALHKAALDSVESEELSTPGDPGV